MKKDYISRPSRNESNYKIVSTVEMSFSYVFHKMKAPLVFTVKGVHHKVDTYYPLYGLVTY